MDNNPTIVTLDQLADDVGESVCPGMRARRSLLGNGWLMMGDDDHAAYGPLRGDLPATKRAVPVTSEEVALALDTIDPSLLGWYQTMEYTAAGADPLVGIASTVRPTVVLPSQQLTPTVPRGPAWRGVRVPGDFHEFVESVAAVVRLRRRGEHHEQEAAGPVNLDNIAAIFGVARRSGEHDNALRARIAAVQQQQPNDSKAWPF